MSLQVLPNRITLFPQDTQRFRLANLGVPVSSWTGISNGTVQSDRSLLYSGAGGFVQGFGLHHLISGIGTIRFTATAACVPASGGSFIVEGRQVTDTTKFFRVTFGTANITIDAADGGLFRYNPNGVILGTGSPITGTLNHILAAGDVVEMETAVRGWKLTINGVLQCQYYYNALTLTYPINFYAKVIPPVSAGTATIPPFDILGDWQPSTNAAWTLGTGAPLSAPSPASGAYTDVTVNSTSVNPGAWTLTSEGEYAGDDVSATILIPSFTLSIAAAIELDPGETIRVTTNYDNAQNAAASGYITRAVVTGGGGSFNAAGDYTAPTTPGTYTIRWTSADQRRDVVVTVRTTLTPTYQFGYPSEQLTMTTNMTGTLTWSVVGGTLNTTSGSTVIWTLPAVVNQKARISVTNGTITRFRDVEVLEKFPYKANVIVPIEREKTVLLSHSENRRRTSRVKNIGNAGYDKIELHFTDRRLDELQAVLAFWERYHPQGRFFFDDLLEARRVAVYFDSGVHRDQRGVQSFDYAFRLIEA